MWVQEDMEELGVPSWPVGELLQLGIRPYELKGRVGRGSREAEWRCTGRELDGMAVRCVRARRRVRRGAIACAAALRVAGSRRRFMTAVQSLLRPALIAECCPALLCSALPCPAYPRVRPPSVPAYACVPHVPFTILRHWLV